MATIWAVKQVMIFWGNILQKNSLTQSGTKSYRDHRNYGMSKSEETNEDGLGTSWGMGGGGKHIGHDLVEAKKVG